jgi:hypothetical protein
MSFYFATLILTFLLNLFAVWRMFVFRMHRKLPFLVSFLVFQCLQYATLLVLTRSPQSRAYETIYEFTEPVNWIFYILIVHEMYSGAFAGFPGIASFARWASYASASLALLLCFGLMLISPVRHTPGARIFSYIELWERFVSFALLAFIVLFIFLLSRYPIKVDSSVAASLAIFTAYFAGSFVFLELGTPATSFALQLQTGGFFLLNLGCFAAWGILAARAPHASSVQLRHRIEPVEEQRLLDQLTFIDNMLIKSSRH